MIRAIYDTQTFDTTAAASLDKNSAHIEMSASMYANPWTDCTTNYLDVVFLGATEIDLDFNVNVMTDSNGVLMALLAVTLIQQQVLNAQLLLAH